MHREELFPTRGALDPVWIAEKLGAILIEEGRGTDRIKAGLAEIAEARRRLGEARDVQFLVRKGQRRSPERQACARRRVEGQEVQVGGQ